MRGQSLAEVEADTDTRTPEGLGAVTHAACMQGSRPRQARRAAGTRTARITLPRLPPEKFTTVCMRLILLFLKVLFMPFSYKKDLGNYLARKRVRMFPTHTNCHHVLPYHDGGSSGAQ